MTTPPPPPPPPPPAGSGSAIPPPQPPPAPGGAVTPLLPWVGGIAAIVLAVVFLPRLFGGDDDPAAGSTTTTGVTTTAATTTTSTPTTSTTAATTTTATTTTLATTTSSTGVPGALIEDRFEGSSSAVPVFGPEFMTFELVPDVGRGEIIATGGGGILPVMYALPVEDVQIDQWFRAFPVNADAGIVSLLVLAEDPAGGVEHYVLIWLDLNNHLVNVAKFIDGGWGEVSTAPIPPAAAFDPTQANHLTAIVDGATVAVSINGTFVLAWDDGFPFTSGYVGPALLAVGNGDRLRVDDFVVVPISE